MKIVHSKISICLSTAFALSLASFGVRAHVTLEAREAPADSYYKAVFRVPHGCDGQATTRLRIQIPQGVTGVKTMLKPGWKVHVAHERLSSPLKDAHGKIINKVAKEVVWSGGRLPDENYDEFVMQVHLPDKPNTEIYFPVVQDCVKGVNRWIEVPEAGKAVSLQQPAPALKLLPKATSH